MLFLNTLNLICKNLYFLKNPKHSNLGKSVLHKTFYVLFDCKFTHYERVNHFLLHLKLTQLRWFHWFERFKDAFYMCVFSVGSSQENGESHTGEYRHGNNLNIWKYIYHLAWLVKIALLSFLSLFKRVNKVYFEAIFISCAKHRY